MREWERKYLNLLALRQQQKNLGEVIRVVNKVENAVLDAVEMARNLCGVIDRLDEVNEPYRSQTLEAARIFYDELDATRNSEKLGECSVSTRNAIEKVALLIDIAEASLSKENGEHYRVEEQAARERYFATGKWLEHGMFKIIADGLVRKSRPNVGEMIYIVPGDNHSGGLATISRVWRVEDTGEVMLTTLETGEAQFAWDSPHGESLREQQPDLRNIYRGYLAHKL